MLFSLRALPRLLHRRNDVGIGAAAADVATHALTDGVIIFAARLFQQRYRRHDLAGGAVAALESIVFQKRSLHGMQFAVGGQAFNSGDAIALVHDGEGEAGIYAAAIDVHGAGTALTVV